MTQNARPNKFIEFINKSTEISILPIDDNWEWTWRCKESEGVFDSPEEALADCINFICRDHEALLAASLAEDELEDESIGVALEEDSIATE